MFCNDGGSIPTKHFLDDFETDGLWPLAGISNYLSFGYEYRDALTAERAVDLEIADRSKPFPKAGDLQLPPGFPGPLTITLTPQSR
jgi:hypothetical protein